MDQKDKIGKLFRFLHDQRPDDPEALKQELRDQGIDIDQVFSTVSKLIGQKIETRPIWAVGAEKKRVEVEQAFEETKRILLDKFKTAKELVEAMSKGELGLEFQQKASAFFRNQKSPEISEADLKSFIMDCHLLDHLKKKDKR